MGARAGADRVGAGQGRGPERAVRAGGRAGIGASCTLEGWVRGVLTRSPFLRAFALFQLLRGGVVILKSYNRTNLTTPHLSDVPKTPKMSVWVQR
eukprot:1391722-Prymnesium_polylepis.1